MKNNPSFEMFSSDVSKLIKCIQTLKNNKMTEYDLKGTTARCLCRIFASEDGLNAGELAGEGEIDKAQVSRCMAALIEKGLAFREVKDNHQYRQKYRLTEVGTQVARDIVETTAQIQRTVRRNIPAEDMDTFYRVLHLLCQNYTEVLAGDA